MFDHRIADVFYEHGELCRVIMGMKLGQTIRDDRQCRLRLFVCNAGFQVSEEKPVWTARWSHTSTPR